jgi:hypothetical protein
LVSSRQNSANDCLGTNATVFDTSACALFPKSDRSSVSYKKRKEQEEEEKKKMHQKSNFVSTLQKS